MVARQSLLSLASFSNLDYLGPEVSDHYLTSFINRTYTLKHQSSFSGIAKMLFRGITSGYFESWLAESAKLNWVTYDLVYLEYSRYGFIARHVKGKNKKLVVRVHNVEKDYFNNRIVDLKSLQNRMSILIKRLFIARQERICVSCADRIICLTNEDKKRLHDLYSREIVNKKNEVIPVALEPPHPFADSPFDSNADIEPAPYLLITGSLWFGPNAEGAAWFIKNVWLRLLTDGHCLSKKYELVIAGSRAGQEITTLASKHKRIRLVDSPGNIKPYFENASIYLAPIFSGAGMKVKVAEALSYGLTVIGTGHALTGYRIKDRENGYRADDAAAFIDALEHYSGLPVENKYLIKAKAYQLFLDDHSLDKSKKLFQQIIESL